MKARERDAQISFSFLSNGTLKLNTKNSAASVKLSRGQMEVKEGAVTARDGKKAVDGNPTTAVEGEEEEGAMDK